jgi:hypothetical protein
MPGRQQMTMSTRKYSTGTKGRLKMHADQCREAIQAHSPGFSLANEFIESLDPQREDQVWQRFQNPEDVLPELTAWLGGTPPAVVAAPPPAAAPVAPAPAIRPASHLAAEVALKKTRAWLASDSGRAAIVAHPPAEAAEIAITQFFKELTSPSG